MELCIDSTRYREETYSNSVELVSGTTGAKLSENNTNILIVIYLEISIENISKLYINDNCLIVKNSFENRVEIEIMQNFL